MRRSWIYSGIGSFLVTLILLLTIIFPVFDPKNSFTSAGSTTWGNTSTGTSSVGCEQILITAGGYRCYATGTIDKVVAYFKNTDASNTYTGDLTCGIYQYVDHSVNFAGSQLALQTNASISISASSYKWVTFTFSTPYTGASGTWYYFVFTGTADATGILQLVYSSASGGYPFIASDTLPLNNPLTGEDADELDMNFSAYAVSTSDTTLPSATINFAGNHSDKGGPYYLPPGESTALSGSNLNGYYTNSSYQAETWVYINTTVTDASGVKSVKLHWYNATTNKWWNTSESSSTLGFVKKNTNYYEINTSVNITNITAGHKYSFDIWSYDFSSNCQKIWWNKTGLGGTATRRYVYLKNTPSTLVYTPLYVYNITVPLLGNSYKADRLLKDFGTDGGYWDTSFYQKDTPGEDLRNPRCTAFISTFLGVNNSINTFTLTNIYFHIWYTMNTTDAILGWASHRGSVVSPTLIENYTVDNADSRSSLHISSATSGEYNQNYNLTTHLLSTTSTSITDNNMYETLTLFKDIVPPEDPYAYPAIISNRSITSFVLLNVPSNATLNASYVDSDSDGMHDWDELYRNYTNPFLSDTDDDGVNDYYEVLYGSDPNNYTDTEDADVPVWYTIQTISGGLTNTTAFKTLQTIQGLLLNTTAWRTKQTINGTIINTSVKTLNVTYPFPVNKSQHVLTGIGNMSVIINGSSWNISLYDNATRTLQAYASGGASAGVQYCDVSDALYFQFNKSYTWFVNATDGGDWENRTYYFTTFNGSGFHYVTHYDPGDQYMKYPYWDGNYLIVADNNAGIYSFSFNENRTEELWLKDTDDENGLARGICGNSTYIFMCTIGGSYGIYAYTFNENATEDFWNRSGGLAGINTYSVDCNETLVFTASGTSGVRVLNYTDDDGFTVLDTYNTGAKNWLNVHWDGTYLWASETTDNKLHVFSWNGLVLTHIDDETLSFSPKGMDDDGQYLYVAAYTDGINVYSFDGTTIVQEYTHLTGEDTSTFTMAFNGNIFVANGIYGIQSYLFEGGSFIYQDNTTNVTAPYTHEGFSNDGNMYIFNGAEVFGIYVYGYELIRVAPPVIDLIYAGNPGKDVVTRDGTIRYVNQSYNGETFCNITANITVPNYRTIGRYFRTTDDNIFIPSGNLTDNDNDYVNERNQSLIASKYSCTFSGYYSKLSAYIVGSGMSQPWTAMAIYSDNAGEPGTLLGFTGRDYPGSDVFTETQRDLGALYYPPSTRIWQTQDIAYNETGASITSVYLTQGNDYWLVFATNDSYGYKTYGYTYSNDIYWLIGNDLGDTCYVKSAPFNLEADMNFSNATGLSWDDALGMNGEEVHYACIYAIANSAYNTNIQTVNISSAILHWYNDSVNTWNMSMTQMGLTGNWTKNVTGLTPGHWYTFDIVAYDELNDDVTYEHYRYIVEGTTERIEFQCGVPYADASSHQGYNSTSTLYRNESVLYLWNRTYGTDTWYGDDEQMEDALPHEQGVDGTADDTGGWEATLPDDTIQARHCLKFAGAWWDDNITIQDTVTLNNVYVHLWGGGGVKWNKMRLHYGQLDTLYNFQWLEITSTRGIEYNYTELQTNVSTRESAVVTAAPETCSDPSGVDDTFRLICEHINLSGSIDDVTFDSGSIYNFFLGYDNNGTLAWNKESAMIINNRSYLSFVIFNIPPDIYNGTDLVTDSDSDGLSDYHEMNVSFTHPFLNDTDGDGYDDDIDSDPNDYQEHRFWNTIQTISGVIQNVSGFKTVQTISGSILNTTGFKTIQTIQGSILNTTGFRTIQTITGEIQNITSFKTLQTISGVLRNTTSFKTLQTISGAILNASAWRTVQTISGEIHNSLFWVTTQTIQGSISNATGFKTVQTIQGVIQNITGFKTVQTITGVILNITGFRTIQTISGILQNTTGFRTVQTINGVILNLSGFRTVQTIAGAITNTTGWRTQQTITGIIVNTTGFKTIQTINGIILNLSGFRTVQTISGSILNTTGFKTTQTISGSILNTTAWKTKQTITGIIINATSWRTVQTISGTILNLSGFKTIQTISGAILNTTAFKTTQTITGTILNTTGFKTVQTVNGVILNTTAWKTVQTLNGTIQNISETHWYTIQTLNGIIQNTTAFRTMQTLNGDILNTTAWKTRQTITGEILNTTNWETIQTINGTILNLSETKWYTIQTINGEILNTTGWETIQTLQGSILNTTGFKTIQTIQGSILNATAFKTIQTLTGVILNTTGFKTIQTINGTILNVSVANWYTTQIITGSIQNVSGFKTIQTITGAIFNVSGFKTIQTINGLIQNTTGFRTIQTITGAITNTTGWRTIQTITGSIQNTSGLFATVQIITGVIQNISTGVQIINIYPINNSHIQKTQPTIFFTLLNSTGDSDFIVYTGNTSMTVTAFLFNDSHVGNSTFHDVYFNATDYYVDYYWRVCVWDNGRWTNETYRFSITHEGSNAESSGAVFGILGLFGIFGIVGFIMVFRMRKRKNNRNE